MRLSLTRWNQRIIYGVKAKVQSFLLILIKKVFACFAKFEQSALKGSLVKGIYTIRYIAGRYVTNTHN